MKHLNSSTGKGIFALMTMSVLFLFSSCAKKIHFSNSSVVPAAEGYVQVKKDKNNNYSLSIKILNLAPPDRLQPPAKTYIVWMDTDQSETKNLGQIRTSNNMISKALKGSFDAVTPFHPVRIFITAENDAAITAGTGVVVLTTQQF